MALNIGTGYGYNPYSAYAASSAYSASGALGADDKAGTGAVVNPGESTEVSPGRKSSPAECETCKNRKYQDGSDEMVSFKTPQKVSPQAAASAVRGHEQEHVSNAYKKAAQNNGKVISANVQIKTEICPECGRSFVAGGTTSTQIKYYNEENPYQKELKAQDADKYKGMHLDLVG